MRGAAKAARITSGSRHPGDMANAHRRGDNGTNVEKTNTFEPLRSRFLTTWGPI